MRTYGRAFALNADGSRQSPQPAGFPRWQIVQTDANGQNDAVWLTTLLQSLQGNINESPFYSQYGTAGQQAVMQQVLPDFYVARMQSLFAPHFAALTIARQSTTPPTYLVNVVTHQGVKISTTVPVPQ